MDVTLATIISGSSFQLTLTFEDQLDNIDFNSIPIDTLIYIYI